MRMWMLPPELLCDKHLRGEHGELHKHRHIFTKQRSIAGRVRYPAQIEPESMKERHDELAIEMLLRGMKHESPYTQPDLSYLPTDQRYVKANLAYNIADLSRRCPDCAARIRRR